MNIAAFRTRITIQKNETVTDTYGNHKSVWTKWFSCWVYASDQTGKEEEETARTIDRDLMDFTVRCCSETEAVTPTGFRIVLKGRIYDIDHVDDMGFKKKSRKFHAHLAERGGNEQEGNCGRDG